MISRKISKASRANYCWFAQVVIVLTLVLVVLWRSLIPKIPDYTITTVYIPALDVHNSTFDHETEAVRNTSIFINLIIFNPNKRFRICYDRINITLRNNNVSIGNQSMPAFNQGCENTRVTELIMKNDMNFSGGVEGGNWSMTELGMHLKTTVRYTIFELTMKHQRIDLEGHMLIGSDGRIAGEKIIKLK